MWDPKTVSAIVVLFVPHGAWDSISGRVPSVRSRPGLAVNLEVTSVCFSAEAQSPCHFFVKFSVNSWHQPLCSVFWPRLSILVRSLGWRTNDEDLFVRAPKQGAPMENGIGG